MFIYELFFMLLSMILLGTVFFFIITKNCIDEKRAEVKIVEEDFRNRSEAFFLQKTANEAKLKRAAHLTDRIKISDTKSRLRRFLSLNTERIVQGLVEESSLFFPANEIEGIESELQMYFLKLPGIADAILTESGLTVTKGGNV